MDKRETILLVDDERFNINLLEHLLSPEYDIMVALSAKQALARLAGDNVPDLILADIMMPDMDGYELCHQLKRDDRTADIPLIFVSAMNQDEDEAKGLGLGAVDYITKPVSPELLKLRVKNHLTLKRQSSRLKRLLEQQTFDRENLEVTVKERTKELEKSRDAAEAGAHAKATFLANMSHEIRTPMNAVIGFSEIVLEDPSLSPEAKEYVDIIRNSANSLLDIIGDILDVSKLDSGKFELERISFHLRNTLSDTFKTLDHLASEKGLAIDFNYDEGLSECFWGDPTRLRQVLLNLVGNAIKFTEVGKVSLTVMKGSSPGLLHFRVEDTGIGMTRGQMSGVFEAFSQANDSTTRRFGGTGLGTTISKQIVELMGGRIWVESELGKGSVFHFTANMPSASDKEGSLYTDPISTEEEYTSPRLFHILIAEDIEVNANLAILRLEKQGHRVDWVSNGREAVNATQACNYDLVLMDVMMPELDGLKATQEIRHRELNTGKHIVILALTASIMQEDHVECLAAGMDGVEGKPIDFTRLLNTMEQLVPEGLGSSNLRTNNITRHIGFDGFSVLDGVVDYKKGLKAWQDSGVYISSLIQFSEERKNDAINIRRLLAECVDGKEQALALVHSLKGVAGNLSVLRVERLAGEIGSELKKVNADEIQNKIDALNSSLKDAVAAISELRKVLI